MPCGPHVYRKAENGFIPERREKHLVSFIWMDYVAATEGIEITHRLSAGREVTVMGTRVDGFAERRSIAYEFDGDSFYFLFFIHFNTVYNVNQLMSWLKNYMQVAGIMAASACA